MKLFLRTIVNASLLFLAFTLINLVYTFVTRLDTNSSTRNSTGTGGRPGANHKLQNGDKVKEVNDSLGLDLWDRWSLRSWLGRFNWQKDVFDRTKRNVDIKTNDEKLLMISAVDTKTTSSTTRTGYVVPMDHPDLRQTDLNDIFISVKTTQKYHRVRLDVLLETWWQLAREQTYFFTDVDDKQLQERTGGHVINTHCGSKHTRKPMCCKMSVEYDTFITSGKRWFCHVDDDTYLNVPALVRLVQSYNHTGDWYLGKPSLNHPVEKKSLDNLRQKTLFWFATGGAGFCLSRAIALKMMPYTAGGKFTSVCAKIGLSDDCTIGFIVYYYLHKELTVIKSFHSHLEGLWRISDKILRDEISFSYFKGKINNIVNVNGFNNTYDPTRFRTIHCKLYPSMPNCPDR